MEAYEKVKLARDKNRATGKDFIQHIIDDFIELHGDRYFADDQAIITGIGRLKDMPVTVIAHERGKTLEERIRHNFGCAHPEGYRKALRHMKLAEKFHRPVLCFVDTGGAFPGKGAEERGQGRAIAHNLMEMMTLKTPVITVLIGEGGSGGALALGIADEVWMLENSVYSVISPEGCASILWKDPKKTSEAAAALKLTAQDLYRMGVIEKIIKELKVFEKIYEGLAKDLYHTFKKNQALSLEELTHRRYMRFRKMGVI